MPGKSGVKVEREPFEYNGKTYYDYYIAGKVRGGDVKVKLGPPDTKDKGGYTVLDIVYGNETRADFIIEPFEFVSADGKTVTGERFLVRTTDKETGEIYECPVKPVRRSDKTLLAMLMR